MKFAISYFDFVCAEKALLEKIKENFEIYKEKLLKILSAEIIGGSFIGETTKKVFKQKDFLIIYFLNKFAQN